VVILPEERPAVLSPSPMFDPDTVYFGKARRSHVDCSSRGQAELVLHLADLGLSGAVGVPAELAPCMKLLDRLNVRLDQAVARFTELAESRTGDARVRQQLVEAVTRWFVLGRETGAEDAESAPEEAT
jgi:hypothetical protein